MSDINLTKDSDALICAIYKEYLRSREAGKTKTDAKSIGSAEFIQKEIVPNWNLGDVEETCWELHRSGLLTCYPADDTVYMSFLSDSGIIYMENRFKEGISEVLGYIEKVKSILLW